MTQPVDRLQGNLTAVLELLMPRVMGQLACFLQWEYRVAVVESEVPPIVVSCVPVDVVRCPFGPLRVPMWPAACGSPCVPAIGSLVVIGFHDGNPAKPAIVAVDPAVPAPVPDVSPFKLSIAGILATFGTAISAAPVVGVPAAAMVTSLEPLL